MNYVAPINGLGFGHFASNLLVAFERAGVEPALIPINQVQPQPEAQYVEVVSRAVTRPFRPEGSCLRVWHPFDLAERVGRGCYGAYTFYELDRFTHRERLHLQAPDVLFVSSQWAAAVAASNGIKTYVVVAQPGVDMAMFHPNIEPYKLKGVTETTTVFLNCGKWEIRKGAGHIADLFNAAFTPQDDVLLVMACHNPLVFQGYDGPSESEKWAGFYLDTPMGRAGKIQVVPGRIPEQRDLARLMAAADVGLFPALAEGWDMPLAEMLAMGKNAIATNYSAHTEFAEAGGAMMVDVDGLEPAHDGFFFRADAPHWEGTPGRWAKFGRKAFEQTVAHMRAAHAAKQEGRMALNQQGINLFTSRFTWDSCAKTILAALMS